ncbi:hypothetical protein [Desulfonatronovibrio hydrogenovorans]|uniref:hypothetical protein n=1 Tax=Desulfonatronovibrio hydrogenovorans TaxID=53245 RepID=UPI00048FA25F|nr:hypothetical protein [Desulfonatronovibrio hydrogenovorans]
MRIFNSGSDEEFVYLAMDNPRVRKFRRKYKQGDVVPGIILEYDSPGLAWVLVDDLRLLAWVARNYFRGQRLHLAVENLYPEIILREIDLTSDNSDGLSIIV